MIDFSPTSEQLKKQKKIIAFAQGNLNEGVEERDKLALFDRKLWKKCGEAGLPGLCIPKEYGGRGLGPVSTVLALEALGYGCKDGGLNFAIAAHLLATVVPIWLHGTEEQKKQLLPGLCNGTLVAANAMTEPSSGSDVFTMSTTAKETANSFVLQGTKTFISNAPVADILLTYAMTNPEKGFFGGISAFILDKQLHAYTCSSQIEKAGIRTCPLGEIHFDDLKVGKQTILGKTGGGSRIFTQSMDWERICLGAIHLGAMKRLLEQATTFIKKQKKSTKPDHGFQAASHTLADIKARLEAAKLLTYKAAWQLEKGKNVALDGAIAKLFVSETFKALTLQINQIFGCTFVEGRQDAERALRDAMASTIYSGSSEIQKNIIARRIGIN